MTTSMPQSIVSTLQLVSQSLEAAGGSAPDAISFLSGAIATILYKTLPPDEIPRVADIIHKALLDKRGCIPGVEFVQVNLEFLKH